MLRNTLQIDVSDSAFRNGYLHFEALSNHGYEYFCSRCGYYPPILVWDLCKKGCFSMARKYASILLFSVALYRIVYLMFVPHCHSPVISASKIVDSVQSFSYSFTPPLMRIFFLVDNLEIPALKDANDTVDIEEFWREIELSIMARGLIRGICTNLSPLLSILLLIFSVKQIEKGYSN